MAKKTITISVGHNTLLYVAIGVILVALLVLNAYAFLRPDGGGKSVANTAENFNTFKAAENQQDKCATPSGYTDEQWKEHMGHHPDLYKECL